MNNQSPADRQTVLQMLLGLAAEPANDAVKLAYLTDTHGPETIEGLRLGCLTGLKRNKDGSVELKFLDRVAVLESLLRQLEHTEQDRTAAFLHALDQGGGEEGDDPPWKEVASRR